MSELLDKTFFPKFVNDESNPLICLGLKTKIKKPLKKENNKILSKTRQKIYQKLQQQKLKREKRKNNLALLEKLNVSKEELNQIISVHTMQTFGKRKAFCNPKISKTPKCHDVDDDIISNDFIQPFETQTNLKSFNSQSTQNIVLVTNSNEVTPLQPIIQFIKPIHNVSHVITKVEYKPILIKRDSSIQKERLLLPILSEEHEIIDSINNNLVVIICGETGSGKTTQVPQFLYEAGYATDRRIGITEPRRVAAITISQRVAIELNSFKTGTTNSNDNYLLPHGTVSYQVRYEGDVNPKTKIKFMTDGILLKEIQNDFLLTDYSAIIIDEAHERSVYTDILIGLLSRIVLLRDKKGIPLKLIIMSATLRVEDFTENKKLFKFPVPVIKIPSKQHAVTIHYNIRTPLNEYLEEAFRKVCKIHNLLPPGGILVFVTGRAEVLKLCQLLNEKYKCRKKLFKSLNPKLYIRVVKQEKSELPNGDEHCNFMPANSIFDDFPVLANKPPSNLDECNGASEKEMKSPNNESPPMCVLPLYSLLNAKRQALVFNYYYRKHKRMFDKDKTTKIGNKKSELLESSFATKPRLCIISTNVAETSVTIPGIKYVVDCGLEKRVTFRSNCKPISDITSYSTKRQNNENDELYNNNTVAQSVVGWISKASADQRAGRCGRTGPNGHCYRLYSSAVFNHVFPQFSRPEICDRPVEDIVLQMKLLNIDRVSNFPFPTPPSPGAILHAEALLCSLGLLEPHPSSEAIKVTNVASNGLHSKYLTSSNNETIKGCLVDYNPGLKMIECYRNQIFLITNLGKIVANLPLNPRFGKMVGIILHQNLLKFNAKYNRSIESNEDLQFQEDFSENNFVGNTDKFSISLLPYALAIAAALSVRELFTSSESTDDSHSVSLLNTILYKPSSTKRENGTLVDDNQNNAENENSNRYKKESRDTLEFGDLSVILRVIGATDFMRINNKYDMIDNFCETFGVRSKGLEEIYKLRKQIYNMISPYLATSNHDVYSSMSGLLNNNNFKRDSLDNPENDYQTENLNQNHTENRNLDQNIITDNKYNNKNYSDDFLLALPPTAKQIKLLRKLVTSCAAFNVAKRIDLDVEQRSVLRKFAQTNPDLIPAHLKNLEYYYQCLHDNVAPTNLDNDRSSRNQTIIIPAFIHHTSVFSTLSNRGSITDTAKYIIYQESFVKQISTTSTTSTQISEDISSAVKLTTTLPYPLNLLDCKRKIFLKTVSIISPTWIPQAFSSLCEYDFKNSPNTLSIDVNSSIQPLKVFYDPQDGLIKTQARCYFGPHRWDIGISNVEYPISLEKYKYYARFFLEGLIFPKLAEFSTSLLLSPDTMCKSWAKLQPKTQNILNALVNAKVDSKMDLTRIWSNGGRDPNFLLTQYVEWVPESLHARVKGHWPPINK